MGECTLGTSGIVQKWQLIRRGQRGYDCSGGLHARLAKLPMATLIWWATCGSGAPTGMTTAITAAQRSAIRLGPDLGRSGGCGGGSWHYLRDSTPVAPPLFGQPSYRDSDVGSGWRLRLALICPRSCIRPIDDTICGELSHAFEIPGRCCTIVTGSTPCSARAGWEPSTRLRPDPEPAVCAQGDGAPTRPRCSKKWPNSGSSFHQEASTLASLSPPTWPAGHRYFKLGDGESWVMDYVEGD